MKKNNFQIIKLKPKKNKSSVMRSVFIKDFIIEEIIGIHDYEKIKKQKVKFNIVIDVDQNTIPDEKNIESIVVNIGAANVILTTVARGSFLKAIKIATIAINPAIHLLK